MKSNSLSLTDHTRRRPDAGDILRRSPVFKWTWQSSSSLVQNGNRGRRSQKTVTRTLELASYHAIVARVAPGSGVEIVPRFVLRAVHPETEVNAFAAPARRLADSCPPHLAHRASVSGAGCIQGANRCILWSRRVRYCQESPLAY